MGSLTTKNASLLFKWWWRFGRESQSLWRSVIIAIHNISVDCSLPLGLVPRCPGTWKGITDMHTIPNKAKEAFWQNLKIEVGDGTTLLFWHHPWAGPFALRDKFKPLFDVSTNKRATIAQVHVDVGDWTTWALNWVRPLEPDEVSSLMDLRHLILPVRMRQNIPDVIQWKDGPSSGFDTGVLRQNMDSLLFDDTDLDPSVTKAWCKLAPPRVEFLIWLGLLRKIHTRDRLVRRGVLTEAENICPICREAKETDSHLFIHCKKVYPFWASALSIWNIQTALPEDPVSLWKTWMTTPI